MSRFHHAPPLGRALILVTFLAVTAATAAAAVIGGVWFVFAWHP